MMVTINNSKHLLNTLYWAFCMTIYKLLYFNPNKILIK